MAHIKISKGLDIPIKGKPIGPVQHLGASGNSSLEAPRQIALDLKAFSDTKLRMLVSPGDVVKVGQPLAESKSFVGCYFVSPAGGTVKEIRRGAKRLPLDIVIDVVKEEEEFQALPQLEVEKATQDQIIQALMQGGHFSSIRSRPFNRLAQPDKLPKAIFVKALESAPFVPPAELQVIGHEKAFQIGLSALNKLAPNKVHLVYRHDTTLKAFTEAQHVHKHTAEGPHPISNVSLHIQRLAPIAAYDDIIWNLNAREVVAIGHQLLTGRCFIEKVISIAGPGIIHGRTGYFKARQGYPIAPLLAGRLPKGHVRLISGDPLTGTQVTAADFLGYYDNVFCALPENVEREFMHFFRLGLDKYTFSKAYLSGHFDTANKEYDFTTNQHGEHRAFIDSSLYDKVMPLDVPTMLLVKAVMAEDFELASTLGLLEVDSEDFALPAFVCPSKIEMPDIIKRGLEQYAKEVLQ